MWASPLFLLQKAVVVRLCLVSLEDNVPALSVRTHVGRWFEVGSFHSFTLAVPSLVTACWQLLGRGFSPSYSSICRGRGVGRVLGPPPFFSLT